MENLRRQYKPETDKRPSLNRESSFGKFSASLAFGIAFIVLINMVTARFVVDGTSMLPTFVGGEFLVIDRFSYTQQAPQRGDIVVFHAPNESNRDFIKRVLGLPGETVEFRNTRLYINGERFDEPYIQEACTTANCPNSILQLGSNEYFVMGDNRNNSTDSRSFGAISLDTIVGEAIVKYWPYTEMSWIAQLGFPDD